MNYYDININSSKIDQQIASEILSNIVQSNRIRSFSFVENGKISLNAKGIPKGLEEIIKKYNLLEETVITDEFEKYKGEN